ncbi:MAG TPA: hypothetical protein VGU73_01785 [Acidimicrobiia bacterium]|nr:hypothetical protein [Acidimicrobiia bacterium]
MTLLRRFGRFWYDFLIGDDWVAATLAMAALGLTAALAASHNPWWLLPVAIAGVLTVSVRRAARAAAPASAEPPPTEG